MTPADGSPAVRARGTIIEARDLVRSFGETPALRGASISVQRGEIVAVMGPSGSGKSTLLHCLAGILVPDSGEVYLRRTAPRHVRRGQNGRACGATASASSSSSASSSRS